MRKLLRSVRERIVEGLQLNKLFWREEPALAWKYWCNQSFPIFDDEVHLNAAMEWLCLAQDNSEGGGVSSFYSPERGWDLPYPETTGYIIGTFLKYSEYKKEPDYFERAKRMGDWEINIQDASGGVLSKISKPILRVFNTGQVILGWCALYEYTGDARYIEAANRAGEYLLRKQEKEGMWINDSHCGARTYYSRVDWALMRLAILSGESRFSDAAYRNIKWVLAQQNNSGWFENCGFNDDLPITHVIGYTLRGLLECQILMLRTNIPGNVDEIMLAVRRAADSVCNVVEQHEIYGIKGLLPRNFNDQWMSQVSDSCLTGNVQLSCVLRRLFHVTNSKRYSQNADTLLEATKRMQIIKTRKKEIRGALAGSFPFYRGYCNYIYPNWATKFFADAILLKYTDPFREAVLAWT